MESIDPVWLFGGIALVAGILLGVLLYRLLGPDAGDADRLRAELAQSKLEIEDYKASVNSHFNKTSELVNELTQDYVKVYRHLAEGAQNLSDTREFTQVLEQPQGQVLFSVDKKTHEPGPDLTSEDSDMDEAPHKTSTPEATSTAHPHAVREEAAGGADNVSTAAAEATTGAEEHSAPRPETTPQAAEDTSLATPEKNTVKQKEANQTETEPTGKK